MSVFFEFDSSLASDEVYIRLSPHNTNREYLLQIVSDGDMNLSGKIENKTYLLKINEIESIYADGNYVLVNSGGTEYKIREKLYEIEKKLMYRNFMRISKSVIVNIKMIDYMAPSFNRQILFKMSSGYLLALLLYYLITSIFLSIIQKCIGFRD